MYIRAGSFVATMPIDSDIAAKGILCFYSHILVPRKEGSTGGLPYRDLLAEETTLPAANHSKQDQTLLPSTPPGVMNVYILIYRVELAGNLVYDQAWINNARCWILVRNSGMKASSVRNRDHLKFRMRHIQHLYCYPPLDDVCCKTVA